MKKLLVFAIILLFCTALHSEPIINDPQNMFPKVELVAPLAHFDGDKVEYPISLYAIKNANHYLDAYKALVVYHNQTAVDATTLAIAYDGLA